MGTRNMPLIACMKVIRVPHLQKEGGGERERERERERRESRAEEPIDRRESRQETLE